MKDYFDKGPSWWKTTLVKERPPSFEHCRLSFNSSGLWCVHALDSFNPYALRARLVTFLVGGLFQRLWTEKQKGEGVGGWGVGGGGGGLKRKKGRGISLVGCHLVPCQYAVHQKPPFGLRHVPAFAKPSSWLSMMERCCCSKMDKIHLLKHVSAFVEPSGQLWMIQYSTIQHNNTLLILKKEIWLSAFDK